MENNIFFKEDLVHEKEQSLVEVGVVITFVKMDQDSLFMARVLFQLEIHKSNGQKFEDFFSSVMGLSNPNFRQVKPQGRLGDRKNDGFDSTKGVYYQVYAPEEPKFKEEDALKKLKTDFKGLCPFWDSKCKIIEFYFVNFTF